ncbi:MAG: aspartate aminotransferase family protein, partial [Thermoleophilia bacterium]|nr:aspartate aminotransferase family protein [Thermoleophilia bacterium]
QAEYLEVLDGDPEWNASDLAIHMTRRARGLPLWFSLAAHGTAAYGRAVAHGLRLARQAAELIESSPMLELAMQPELSVVVFRRLGWGAEDYKRWSTEQLERGLTLTVPTVLAEETLLRFCFINPQTTDADIGAVLDSLV